MQVRVHRDHGIEQPCQEPAHHLLAHGLTGVEGDVLPHIGQVRRHQREVLHAEVAGRTCGQQQLHQFFIGLVQATQQHGVPWQAASGLVHRQAQLEFAIGETMAFDGLGRQTGGLCQAQRRCGFVVEIQHARGFRCGHGQNSTNTRGTSSAVPSR